MSDSRATVTAYWRREDAGRAQHALGDAGIDALVEEKDVSRVRVEREQALRAGDVLNRTCDDLPEVGEADEDTTSVCPACDSPEVVSSMRGRTFLAILTVVMAVAIAVEQTAAGFLILSATGVGLLVAQRWRCESCGEKWD
jgi:hypothetical protein